MEPRYQRNLPAITEEEQQRIRGGRVLVVGCGGLGGYVLEYLLRLGVGHITAVDADAFEQSNLNRQLLSRVDVIGSGKAETARERARLINPEVDFTAVHTRFAEDNAREMVKGHHVAMDALDNIPSRLLLEDVCEEYGLPIVHGAVTGWYMQAAVALPGKRLLHGLYPGAASAEKTCMPFTPAFCAAVQCAEAAKLLCGRPSELEGRLLLADLRCMDWSMFQI